MDHVGCRMVGKERQDPHLAADTLYGCGLGQRLSGIVPALGEDLRSDELDESLGRVLFEADDVVDAGESLEHAEPIVEWVNWALRPFQPPPAFVAVDTHDEHVPERLCASEVVEV